MTTRPGVAATSPASASVGHVRQVVRNGLFLLLAYVLPRVFTFGSIVVAARVLGARDFGYYATAGALAVMLSVVATLGMMPLLIREVARRPDRSVGLIREAHRVKTGANLVMLLALFGVSQVAALPPMVVSVTMLLGIAYAIGAYAENYSAYFQGREQMDVWTMATVLQGLIQGVVGVVVVLVTRDMLLFAVTTVLGQAAALAWLTWKFSKVSRVHAHASPIDSHRLWRQVPPFAVAFLLLTVYYKIDVLLLAKLGDAVQVGLYSAAYRFFDITQALVLVAIGAVYPKLVQAGTKAPQGVPNVASRVVEMALMIMVPVTSIVWLMREHIVLGLLGDGYLPSAGVLMWLVPAFVPLAINLLGGYVLSAAGRMSLVALMYGAALVLNVCGNVLLQPIFGSIGAGQAKLISETVLAVGFVTVLLVVADVRLRAVALAASGGVVLVAAAMHVVVRVGDAVAVFATLGTVVTLYTALPIFRAPEWRTLRQALSTLVFRSAA